MRLHSRFSALIVTVIHKYAGVIPVMLFKNLKAHVSRSVLAGLAICSFIPDASAAAPVFIPTTQWKVGTTQLSNVRGLENMKMPCVLSNEFDNGYLVRFSGGGGQMLALAVDFRQDVFHQGRKYSAMLSVGDGYAKQVEATAFTTSTLIFNLRPVDDFYNIVRDGSQMGLDIDGNTMEFALADLKAAYGDFEACYAGAKKPEPVSPMLSTGGSDMPSVPAPAVESAANAPQSILPPPVENKPMPQSFEEIVRNADAANVPVAVPSMRTTGVPVATWNAKAGEDIRAVLARWSQNAGYDLEWQANQGGTVAQDIAVRGKFEDAVSQLMAENVAAMGINARIDTSAGSSPIQPVSNDTSLTPEPVPPVASAPVLAKDEWQASSGSNIQSVLEQWAGRAGVAVVWQDYMSVAVKSTVNVKGGFEDAVQALLDQYGAERNRPVGQLNIDPKTGQKTLLMSMESHS